MSEFTKANKHRPHQVGLILAYIAPGVLGAAWGLGAVLLVTTEAWNLSHLLMYTLFLALISIPACYWASTVQKRHQKRKEHFRK